jgi:hypothetical protein
LALLAAREEITLGTGTGKFDGAPHFAQSIFPPFGAKCFWNIQVKLGGKY